MDKIYKKISLEDFKNRFSNKKNDAFETAWGNVALYDYVIDTAVSINLYAVAEKIPLLKNDTTGELTRLRFGTMINLHTWLANIIESSDFFKLCLRNGEKRWIVYDYSFENEEDFTFKGIYEDLPINYEEFDVGDIIWVTTEAENLLNMFLVDSEEEQSLILIRISEFLNVFESARENLQETTGFCYADINVILTENCNEIGKFTKAVKPWELNKEYEIGEYCIAPEDGKTYVLSGETAETATWEPCEEEAEYMIDSSNTIYVESRLSTLRRVKHSYDDDGNELPFIYNGTEDGELEYVTGLTYNVTFDGDEMYGDVITDIEKGVDTIIFTYVIGAKIDDNGSADTRTGITYKEGYKKTDKTLVFKQDRQNVTVNYIDIHFNEELEPYFPEDAENGKQYALITKYYSSYSINSGVPFIMEESLVEITDVSKSGTASVERGTSAAFEIHNILGECRTMEDLEKYRNDFFTIKDDEKQ